MSDTQTPDQPKGAIARFLAAPPDSVGKTIFVAVALCLAASMIVSLAAVNLRPVQEANKLRDKQLNVLQVSGVYEPGMNVADAFASFEPQILDLATGDFVADINGQDAAIFDDIAAASDPELSVALSNDPAGIGRKANYRVIYLLKDEAGAIDKVILPIHGYGLWSTLYGFIALEANGNDIFGLQFYQHGETPGLGAEVDNPRWKTLWNGKKLRDEAGDLQINVSKAQSPAGPDFHIDALAGATLTSVGVDNLVKFWLGDEGYAPFLAKLKAGEL